LTKEKSQDENNINAGLQSTVRYRTKEDDLKQNIKKIFMLRNHVSKSPEAKLEVDITQGGEVHVKVAKRDPKSVLQLNELITIKRIK
jgi:hypothetical protein